MATQNPSNTQAVPNLDDDPRARRELAALRQSEVVQIYGLSAEDACRLMSYASAKTRAVQARLEGRIVDAFMTETRCDSIYAELSPKARW